MNLPPSMLRRIYARCVVRARGYKTNHPKFSERYFCCGAAAVLTCFRDPESKALAGELLADAFFGTPISDQSAKAKATRAQRREADAKLRAWRANANAELRALIEQLSADAGKEQAP